ncbi:hypothetical protein MTR_6g018890 [Medicago truncatula]|uniref:Uncharacterized protein n=1 Tax=Medicago truncatula TaxID=3880 RepID=A0A072UHX2_MEDTR|nr:hypothetical protein MTR_6g018890 [Medicago truncatula]
MFGRILEVEPTRTVATRIYDNRLLYLPSSALLEEEEEKEEEEEEEMVIVDREKGQGRK